MADVHTVMVDVIIIGISGYFVCKNTNYILLEENYGYVMRVSAQLFKRMYNFEKYNLARNWKLSCRNDVESTM